MGNFQAKKTVYDFFIKNFLELRESLEKDLETWLKFEELVSEDSLRSVTNRFGEKFIRKAGKMLKYIISYLFQKLHENKFVISVVTERLFAYDERRIKELILWSYWRNQKISRCRLKLYTFLKKDSLRKELSLLMK
jgi:hypothetical protein